MRSLPRQQSRARSAEQRVPPQREIAANSPASQPLDHLFRVLRAHVTYNPHRITPDALEMMLRRSSIVGSDIQSTSRP